MEKHARGRFEGLWLAFAVSIPVAVGALAIALYRFHFPGTFEVEQAKWGTFGDFIGGILNPVVGVVTLVLLVKTLLSQQRAIQLQSEELRLQRRELTLQRTETAKSTQALDDQYQAIVRQSFEQSLFTWLANYRELVREVRSRDRFLSKYSGRALLEAMSLELTTKRIMQEWSSYVWRRLERQGARKTLARAVLGIRRDQVAISRFLALSQDQYLTLDGAHESALGTLYRTLFRILDWIDRADLGIGEKWHYVALIRAQLSKSELVFLLFNGLYQEGENLGALCDKYAIFDNLRTNDDFTFLAIRYGAPFCQLQSHCVYYPAFTYSETAFDSTAAKAALGLNDRSVDGAKR